MSKSKVPNPDDYKVLQPFVAHGVEFTSWRGDEALADSPLEPSGSGRSDHFHVNVNKRTWHDKKTGAGGSVSDFLTAIQTVYREAISPERLATLARDRALPIAALKPWGWDGKAYTLLVPCVDGRACDIRRYTLRTHEMKSTWGCDTGLLGVDRLKDRPIGEPVYVCEGEWDAIFLADHLRRIKQPGSVVAVPGASTFKKEWCPAVKDRDVFLLYDHDNAGREGERRTYGLLSGTAASIQCVHWPKKILVKGVLKKLPQGSDVRDWFGPFGQSWKALQKRFTPAPRLGVPEPSTSQIDSATLDELMRLWVYAYETKRFIYIGEDAAVRAFYELDKESFSDRYANLFPNDQRQRAAALLMLAGDCKKVARPAYLPNQPQLTTERVKGTELPVINLWIPSELALKAGRIEPYHEHAAHVIVDEAVRQTFYDWFAFLLRHLERKPNWAVFLGGKQGLGKDTLVWPIAQTLGTSNYCTPGPDDLDSTYNDFLRHSKLVVVDTVRFRGRQHLMERLKPWIASPPERIRINGKYVVQYDIANLVAFVFMANRQDALALDPDDRRFFVYWSPATPKDRAYYQTLWTWIRAHVGAIGHYFLHEHAMSAAFDPLAPPPMTEAKRTMIRANEPALLQVLRQSIEEGRGPFARELVTMKEIEQHLLSQATLRTLSQTPHAIGAALKELDVVKLDHRQIRVTVNPHADPERHREERRHVWVVRNADRYRDMNAQMLAEEYERQRKRGRSPSLTVVRGRKA